MLTHAILQGKLRSVGSQINEQLEDLLTSEIFSRLRYLDLEVGLIPILNRVQNVATKQNGLPIQAKYNGPAAYSFWPKLTLKTGNKVEPDLIIELRTESGEQLVVVVECKHLSGKSGGAISDDQEIDGFKSTPQDQLVKELLVVNEHYPEAKVFLLYLTGHTNLPENYIVESVDSIKDFEGTSKTFFYDSVYWIGWKDIWNILSEQRNIFSHERLISTIIEDITKLLEYHGYRYYQGIPKPLAFIPALKQYTWYKSGFLGWQNLPNFLLPNKSIVYYERG